MYIAMFGIEVEDELFWNRMAVARLSVELVGKGPISEERLESFVGNSLFPHTYVSDEDYSYMLALYRERHPLCGDMVAAHLPCPC